MALPVSAEGGAACALRDGVGAIVCSDGYSAIALRIRRGVEESIVPLEIGAVSPDCSGGARAAGLDCEWLGESFAAFTADGICQPVARDDQGGYYPPAEPRVTLTPLPRIGDIPPPEATLLNGVGQPIVAHFFPAPDGFRSLCLDARSSEYLHVTPFDANGGATGETVRFPTRAVSDDPCRSSDGIGSRGRLWADLPSLLMLRSEYRESNWFTGHRLLLDLARVDGNGHPFFWRTWEIADAHEFPWWSCNGFDFEARDSRFFVTYGVTPPDSLIGKPTVHVRHEDTRATEPIQQWSFESADGIAAPTLGWAGESPLVVWMQRFDGRWRLVTWSPSYAGPEFETGRVLTLGDGEQTAPNLIRGPGGFLCVYREIPIDGTARSTAGSSAFSAALAVESESESVSAIWSSIRAVRLSAAGHLLGAPTQVSTLAGTHIAPLGVWNGAAYIVDWAETPSRTVYGQRLAATGAPSSPREFVLADRTARRGAPAAGSDGTVALPYDAHFRLLFDTLAPALPAAPNVSRDDGAIRIEWQAPSDGAHARLYRANFEGDVIPPPPVGYNVVAEREGSGGPQVTIDHDVDAGGSYAYAVGFEGPSGESIFGPAVSVGDGEGDGDGDGVGSGPVPRRFQLTSLSSPGRGAVRFRLDVPTPGGRPAGARRCGSSRRRVDWSTSGAMSSGVGASTSWTGTDATRGAGWWPPGSTSSRPNSVRTESQRAPCSCADLSIATPCEKWCNCCRQ